ncbi:hypothetical protein BJ508DRAFT_307611 [Ascobolus immersus RN42]|uniref:Uncharacterized protein n=1 Tax=Ascobolus immersus RN42 TaxID=1160509 RepID=A0A3N4IET3_ASCIM|nr:hypothetical protein BJ508DRAFT_307611 [Ascobolus immersus RN42]
MRNRTGMASRISIFLKLCYLWSENLYRYERMRAQPKQVKSQAGYPRKHNGSFANYPGSHVQIRINPRQHPTLTSLVYFHGPESKRMISETKKEVAYEHRIFYTSERSIAPMVRDQYDVDHLTGCSFCTCRFHQQTTLGNYDYEVSLKNSRNTHTQKHSISPFWQVSTVKHEATLDITHAFRKEWLRNDTSKVTLRSKYEFKLPSPEYQKPKLSSNTTLSSNTMDIYIECRRQNTTGKSAITQAAIKTN